MKQFLKTKLDDGDIIVNNSTENKKFLKIAYEHAEADSDLKTTKVGTIIVNNGEIIARGANKYPPGIKHNERRLADPYFWVDHAERQAVYFSAKNGVKLDNSIMYMPWFPCSPCAFAIISAGISKLVTHHPLVLKTEKEWLTDIRNGIQLLIEAKITVETVTERLNNITHTFSTKKWKP